MKKKESMFDSGVPVGLMLIIAIILSSIMNVVAIVIEEKKKNESIQIIEKNIENDKEVKNERNKNQELSR